MWSVPIQVEQIIESTSKKSEHSPIQDTSVGSTPRLPLIFQIRESQVKVRTSTLAIHDERACFLSSPCKFYP